MEMEKFSFLEWYSYLLNLKHDLQISNNELSINRVLKTQTNPFKWFYYIGEI